jgi:soluble lytic murein transglycosylase-like protein
MAPAPATVDVPPLHWPKLPVWLGSCLLALAVLGFTTANATAEPASAAGVSAQEQGLAQAANKRPVTKIYKYMAGGITSFSDMPPRTGPYVVVNQDCYACKLDSAIDWRSTRLHSDKFADEINVAARQYNVDPALVRAVIHAESGFNARARSNKGAIGLMQLMPATARSLGVTDARAPSHNIRGGTQYLAGLMARFHNNIVLATAAYNAGPEAVQKYSGVPPFAETQVYVQRVRILHQRYKTAPQS